MLVSVVNLKCSNCGESLAESMSRCPSCDQPVVIKKMSSLFGVPPAELNMRWRLMDRARLEEQDNDLVSDADFTAGCCFLRLKMFDRAMMRFDKTVTLNPGNADAFFCMAVSALKGKRPFLVPLADIRKAHESLDAAVMIEERAIFRLFLAYVKYDFFARRFLQIEPDWQTELLSAVALGLTDEDVDELFTALGQACPKELLG